MLPTRVYYCRISDDRQDFIRQVNGLRQLAERNGDEILDSVWEAVKDKKPMPSNSPVLWDFGSRDMTERRPNFQAIVRRVEEQKKAGRHKEANRLQEFCIYELDRFGVEDVNEWFHYRWLFNKAGCRIVSAMKGDLTAKNDLRTIIETLFEAINSTAEQKKIAGRVADQMTQLARDGTAYLGGVPRYGYDLGCLDGNRLVWRLHYRDRTDRLQIIATDVNPNAELVPSAQFVQFVGKDNHPTKSKNQRYELIPSVDAKRVEGVKFLFKTAKTLFPAISPSQLARQMAAMGYTSFGGVSFDGDNLLAMLADETYVGRRPYGKRSVARHKRWNKNVRDDSGRNLEDVPEDSKGKTVWREKDDQYIPSDRTHEKLIEEDDFAAVQLLLQSRPKRGERRGYAPKSDEGWLKPVLYCGTCGRGMKTTVKHGKRGYCCQSYQMRYQRPGDKRFECSAGLNWIRHDELEPALADWLDGIEEELLRELGMGSLDRLQEEVDRHEALAREFSSVGFRNHLQLVRDALDVGQGPESLADLIDRLLRVEDADEQIIGLSQLEAMLAPVVQEELAKCEDDHRDFSKAMVRPSATPRQLDVWEAECRRLEDRMAKLNRLTTPFQDQAALVAKECEAKRRQLEEARELLKQGQNRAKGAALARIFSRIFVFPPEQKQPGKKDRDRAVAAVLVWTDALQERLLTMYEGVTTFRWGESQVLSYYRLGDSRSSLNLLSAHGSPRMW